MTDAAEPPATSGSPDPASAHVPVMLQRVVDLLADSLQSEGAVLIDATLGMGGHSQAVLERCPNVRVVGIDRDPQALAMASGRLSRFGKRFTGVEAVYDELPSVLDRLGVEQVAAVLFDLGVSSLQLDVAERGFAYREDAPLDMRMGSHGQTAADILNTYPVAELTRILRDFGEEKFAKPIARAVERERASEPFTTSARLVELLYKVIPAPARRTGGHPAKRTFQALRIEVNDELAVLQRAIPAAIDAIGIGGRVVVESYHSLEDRLVKRAFARAVATDVPLDLPFVPEGHDPRFRLVTRGAEGADQHEVATNPRAASVRLRAIERIRGGRLDGPGTERLNRQGAA